MITRNGFRIILLAAVLCACVSAGLNYLAGLSLPPEVQAHLVAHEAPFDALDIFALTMVALGCLMAVIATAGFCLFWRPARTVAITATIFLMFGDAFVRPLAPTGMAHLFGNGAALLWGMAIAFS